MKFSVDEIEASTVDLCRQIHDEAIEAVREQAEAGALRVIEVKGLPPLPPLPRESGLVWWWWWRR